MDGHGVFFKKTPTKADFRFWKYKGFEKPMTNKIKKFLYTLEHLIPDGYDEIPTFALYHPLLFSVI